MNSDIDLQKYFDLLPRVTYKGIIASNFDNLYYQLLLDIRRLLNFDIFGIYRQNFSHAEIINDGREIDCIFSVFKLKNPHLYITLANQIAQFFNDEFPYSEKELNCGLPITSELRAGYKLENSEGALMYSAGIQLSNELTEIRFTIYKN